MKIRVMLVDDEAPFVDTLAQRLTMRDFNVSKAYNGNQCLEAITANPHETDVVVLDILMPGLSGIEVLKRIKAINPLMQVVLLSGQATVETAIEGMKQGAHDFLIKPTEAETLALKIREAAAVKASHEDRIQKAETDNIIQHKGW
ncbi:response regulator receiver domain-containing protein [Desulfobotulus alkaliphilus]|uniref:Response regulator receiver domain-containing protein n=1 Tax=Desulfobotulus alkaliphilus TaxID=622671 RepID=A0A562RYJ6_9BACT|nr:response regulator [Desulfobotulus alkaliphilus]TWI74142.1 response regulator receiver domain-containing protein [Desulfobotulus alkaliphilus]